jgi:hypothetical protein
MGKGTLFHNSYIFVILSLLLFSVSRAQRKLFCVYCTCIFVKISTCQLFFVVFGKLIYAIAMSNTLFRQKVWADGFFGSFLRQNGELFVGTIQTPGGIEMSLCNIRPLMDHCNADSQKTPHPRKHVRI